VVFVWFVVSNHSGNPMNEERLKSLILEHIRSLEKGKIRRRELYGRLGLKNLDYGEFKRVLGEIENSGELVRLKGRSFSLPDAAGQITGEFISSRHGGGFLRPETGDPVYIRREDTGGALSGDTVRVRLTRRGHVGINRAGEVTSIVKRSSRPLVGVYRKVGRTAFLIPSDKVFIENLHVSGWNEEEPRDGDVVVCRIGDEVPGLSLPSCEVVEILGPPDAPGVDVLVIARRHDLPIRFPEEVIEESRIIPADLGEEIIRSRRDIRGEVTFTIDPTDARDFDDAISIEKLDGGGWRIGVHIADVAHYVPEDSATDIEARFRGMSCYLVDRVIPMLPERLSNELCSLRPDEDRLTKSVFARLDSEGVLVSHEIADTVIHSRARLTYEQVQAFLDNPAAGDAIPAEVQPSLTTLAELTVILSARREARGSIDFDIPEAKVILDSIGFPVDIVKRPRLMSHRMVEEAMLLANTVTATALAEAGAPFLYRIHDVPDAEKLETYADIAMALGHDFRESRASDPLYLREFLASIHGSVHERVLNTLLLRSMKKAVYSPSNIGHFGLALPVYAHFTSPIRRYPDLLMHRQIARSILGTLKRSPHRDPGFYEELGAAVTAREILTDKAERDSIKMKTARFMEARLGEEFDGTISGIIPIGFFVELDDIFVEGLVHVSTLDDDYYEIDNLGVALNGRNKHRRFMIGDRLRIVVSRTDKDRGEVDFVVIEQKKRPKEVKTIKKEKKKGRPGRRG
jgi:ribonuclease R